jgi:hypothetical protein
MLSSIVYITVYHEFQITLSWSPRTTPPFVTQFESFNSSFGYAVWIMDDFALASPLVCATWVEPTPPYSSNDADVQSIPRSLFTFHTRSVLSHCSFHLLLIISLIHSASFTLCTLLHILYCYPQSHHLLVLKPAIKHSPSFLCFVAHPPPSSRWLRKSVIMLSRCGLSHYFLISCFSDKWLVGFYLLLFTNVLNFFI